MGIVAIVHEVVQVFVERLGFHLPVVVSDGDDFVFRKFYGTSLVDIDMSTSDTDDTLVLVEHGVDGGGIGLCATRQEKYLGIGHADSLADTLLGTLRELVEAIRCGLLIIVLDEILQHFRMGTIVIVTFK